MGLGAGSVWRDAWFDGVQFAVTCPADITVNSGAGICTAQLNYTSPGGVQTAGLASGSSFPVGTTVNTFQLNETAQCSFTVTVADNEPPKISCPDGKVVPATSPKGAQVTFNATDNCPAAPEFVSEPASGSVFAIGVTTVTCAAKDDAGNVSTGTFTVTVKGAAEQITDLIVLVQSFSLRPPIENSPLAKLRDARTLLSRGVVQGACGKLKDFIAEVMAQAGKNEITQSQVDLLIQEATRIRAVLDCSALGL